MEKENQKPEENFSALEGSDWLDEILGTTDSPKELTGDELAMAAAGLTSPADAELEKILAEDWNSVPDAESDVLPEQLSFDETQAFTPPAVQEESPKEEPVCEEPVSTGAKSRPARKKGYGLFAIPHLFSALIWLSITVIIGVTLGRAFWAVCTDLMAFGKESTRIIITITEDDLDDPEAIANILGDAGLIKYPDLFEIFYRFKLNNTNKDRDDDNQVTTLITAGTFTLNSANDYNAMVKAMGSYEAAREEIEITIPEGYTCAQIFALLEKKGVCSVAELEEYAANGDLGDYWFLEGVKRGSKYCLEGYLFPDTYRFYTNDSPRSALRKLLNGFEYRFTSRMQEKYEEMQKNGKVKLTMQQVITLASMIEKETSNRNESYDISAVYHNRLANSAAFPYLDCDATIYYAIGDYFGTHGPLTITDMETDSPYNTSWRGGHTGLPIGPICNPGSNSIDAALAPSNVNYYYYVYYPAAGKHLFAKTLNEHNANVSKVG